MQSCTSFKLSSLDRSQVQKLLETPAFKAFGVGLGYIDNKNKFLMSNYNYYYEVLDTLGMDKEKDSLFYYQYLAKYFEKVNVKISNINLTLKVNDKKLVAYAEYSNKGIISIKDFVGDDELFDELITEFSLAISFDIYVEGFLRSKPVKEIILNEKQNYFIQSKNSKIISAYRTISDE